MLQSARVATLDRAAGLVRFAGYKLEHLREAPMPADAQDWPSWMLQLRALLAADPALRQPGQRIAMFVTGARRNADEWTFVVQGPAMVTLEPGPAGAYAVPQARPAPAGRHAVRGLAGPARGYLPVRARLSDPEKNESLEFTLR